VFNEWRVPIKSSFLLSERGPVLGPGNLEKGFRVNIKHGNSLGNAQGVQQPQKNKEADCETQERTQRDCKKESPWGEGKEKEKREREGRRDTWKKREK